MWITGASSGIGRSLAKQFSEGGAKLVLSGRNMDALKEIQENCSKTVPVEILPMGLEKSDELAAKLDWVLQKMGGLHVAQSIGAPPCANCGFGRNRKRMNPGCPVSQRLAA